MKKLRELQRKNGSLFYFWRGYLVFGIVLFGCMLPLCIKSFLLIEKNVQTNTYKNVEKGMEILDNEIVTLNNIVLDVQSYKYFSYIRAIGENRKSSDYYAFVEMQQKLMDATKHLSFAKNCMLYFPENLIFFYDNVYVIEAQDSSKRLMTEKYGKIEEWFDVLDNEKYTHAFLEADKYYDSVDGEFYGIPYVHTYVHANKEENPLLVTIFPIQSLVEVWRLQDLQDIAGITISNGEKGKVIYTNDKVVKGWSSDITVSSKKSNLFVRVCIPNGYFFQQLSGLIAMGALYILGFVLVAVVVSVRLAYKNTEKHTALNQEVSHWMLREQILNGLDGKQLEEFRERHREFPTPFRLVIIQLTHTEWSILTSEIKAELAEQKIQYWFFSKVKPNHFVMLCNMGELNEHLRGKMEHFVNVANQKWKCDCLVSVGEEHDSLEDLKEMYQLVLANMKYFSERKLLFHEDVEEFEKNNISDLNVLENIRLTDMILSGNQKSAVMLIKSQWEKVKAARRDSMLKQLFFMQSMVLNSIAQKLNYDISDANLSYDDSVSVMESKMIGVTEKLCGLVQRKKEDDKNDIPKKIIDFMEENYSNPEFYMTTLVEAFGLSDKTIAKLIKSYLNKTFSEYLEELRLQKALVLLDDSSNNIKYIASASGFSSENTFFKVFKRRFGISPSNYRMNKQMLETQEES